MTLYVMHFGGGINIFTLGFTVVFKQHTADREQKNYSEFHGAGQSETMRINTLTFMKLACIHLMTNFAVHTVYYEYIPTKYKKKEMKH